MTQYRNKDINQYIAYNSVYDIKCVWRDGHVFLGPALLERPDADAIPPTNSSKAFNEIRTLTGSRPRGSAGSQQ